MIVDPLIFEQMGQLQFTPALYGDYLIAKYKAWPCDGYTQAASVKHCWLQPGGAPNTFLLSFELHIHETVGEVSVSVVFPKSASIFNVNTNGVGTWRNYGGHEQKASGEYVWDIGNFAFGKGMTRSSVTNVVEPLAATIRPGEVPAGSPIHHSPPREHHTSMVVYPFTCTYVADPAASRASASVASLNSLRDSVSDMGGDDTVAGGDIPMPALCLSYATTSTASGIEVQRLKIIPDDGPMTTATPTMTVSVGGTDVQVKRKPQRSACHRTLHSQQVEVVSHL